MIPWRFLFWRSNQGVFSLLTHNQFGPCYIFNVVSTAILRILLILSALSTLVFSSKVKIRASDLRKRFLSVSSPIISLKFSCTRLVKFSKKFKNAVCWVNVNIFLQEVFFKFLINLFKNECGIDTTAGLCLFKTKKIVAWLKFLLL